MKETDMEHVWKALDAWATKLGVIADDPNPAYSRLDRLDGLK